MKTVVVKFAGALTLLFLVTASATLPARAQQGERLQLGSLDKLEPRASESVDVSLDGKLLELAAKFLNSKKPEEAAIKELILGLKGIYVKVYEFDQPGLYSPTEVETIRTQLRAPLWTRMVGVKSKKEGDHIEVYMMQSANRIDGIAVISTNPKQLAVVQIVGSIDLEKLIQLSGKLGIPSININIDGKEPKE